MSASLKLEEVITAVFPFEKAIMAFEEKATGHHAKVMMEFAAGAGEEKLPW